MEISRNLRKHIPIASGYINIKGGIHYPTFYDECALSCSSPQPLSTINHLHFLVFKRKIPRTLTFRLCYANQFKEGYEKATTEFTQFAFNRPSVAANQNK